MPIGGRLADRYSPRILASLGCLLVGSSLVLFGDLDPQSGWGILVLPQLVRGAGLALLMAPLLTAALNAVPRRDLAVASSFFNVAQNVGGALGIALINNYVTHAIQQHAVRLGEVFPSQSSAFSRFDYHAAGLVVRQAHGILATPAVKTLFAAHASIMRRAEVLGFDNGFVFAGIILFLGILPCLMLQPSAHHLQPTSKDKFSGAVSVD